MHRTALARSRRQFLRGGLAVVGSGLLSSCGPLPFPAQQASGPRTIGFLAPTTGPYIGTPAAVYEAFRRGLRDLGYAEGRDIIFDYRPGADRAQLAELAAELVRRKVDLVVAAGVASYAMQTPTDAIPVVFGFSGDPVEAGFVDSFARPGRNMTGMTFLGEKLGAKRLELLTQAAPEIARVAVLAYPGHPGERREWRDAQAAARSLGVTPRLLQVSNSEDFDRAFEAMASEPTDALLAFSDNITLAHRARMAEFALERRLPSVFGWKEYAEAGGLLSYGPTLDDSWARIAVYADKILKGAQPADLPVEQPTEFEFVINLKTARALGLTIPPSVLQQATEVIQ
jgi:putative ABC transport system substrate-binding protein